jgi:hypothetical protein
MRHHRVVVPRHGGPDVLQVDGSPWVGTPIGVYHKAPAE